MIRGSDHRPNEELHARAAPRARRRAARVHPPRARPRRRRKKLSKRAEGATDRLAARRRDTRPRRCAPTSRSSACPKHDVHLDLDRIRSLAGRRARASSDDEALAARVGVPVEAAPLCAARTTSTRRARSRATILDPPAASLPRRARDARAVRASSASPLPTCSTRTRRRAIVRELKAVGGHLRALRAGADRPRARARALGRAARAAARRGACGGTTLSACGSTTPTRARSSSCRAPPGPVRMYFCGPTVYARAHVGNARPFVIGMWLRSWLRATRLRRDARPQHHRRQRQDLRRRARRERRARRAGDRVVPRGHGRPRARACPTTCRRRPSTSRRSSRFIEELVEPGFAYAVDGDVYFRVASFPEYGRLSGQRPDQVEEQEPNPLKEDPRDFALWKANKPATRTRTGTRRGGAGRPGWHIECSAMAEELLGPAFEIHGGGLDLVFPHHENEVAQSRALGHPFAQIWAHNGMLQLHRRQDVEVARQHRDDPRGARRVGPRDGARLLPDGHWRKPIDFSDETMAQAAAQAGQLPQRLHARRRPSPTRPAGSAFAAALDDDFNTPAALAVLHELARGAARAAPARASRSSGSARSPSGTRRPPRCVELPSAASRRGPRATSSPPTGCATRSRRLGWEMRDEPGGGYTLVRRR